MSRKKTGLTKYGYTFKSGLELRTAEQLVKAGVEWYYERDYIDYQQSANGVCLDCDSVDIRINRTYNPDFVLPRIDGGITYLEDKGKFDMDQRRKMLAVKKSTEIDVRMVFERDNWLTKKHATRYSDWCRQKGYQCCVEEIPPEWLKGIKKLK